MKWIKFENDILNVDKFIRIWIENSENGFFLMGELERIEGEDVVISEHFETYKDCHAYLDSIRNWFNT